jgi:signal transduction histidine kinase
LLALNDLETNDRQSLRPRSIRREFLPHVFERFRQADTGLTRGTPGLGFGLSIVRHIVEMHGGSEYAASEGEGRGSRFRVQLPVMIVHDEVLKEAREHPRTERRAR